MAALVSVDDIKIHVPIRQNFSGADDRIQALIDLATLQIEEYTNRSFAKSAQIELFESYATGPYDPGQLGEFSGGLQRPVRNIYYVLSAYPLDEGVPVRVWYDPLGEFGDETELTGGRDFFVVSTSKNVRLLVQWPTKAYPNSIKVSYTAGYEEDNGTLQATPDALKQACILQTMHLMNKIKQDSISVDEDRSQDGKTGSKFSVPAGLIPEAQNLVARYART